MQLYDSIFCCESHKPKRLADQNEWFWWDSKWSVSLSNHKTDTHKKQVTSIRFMSKPRPHLSACTHMYEHGSISMRSSFCDASFKMMIIYFPACHRPARVFTHMSLLVLIGCSKSLTRPLHLFKFQKHTNSQPTVSGVVVLSTGLCLHHLDNDGPWNTPDGREDGLKGEHVSFNINDSQSTNILH